MIKYDHKAKPMGEAFGVAKTRELEIDEYLKQGLKDPSLTSVSTTCEYVEKKMKRMTESEYLYLGFMVGSFLAKARAEMEGKMSKIQEAIKKALE